MLCCEDVEVDMDFFFLHLFNLQVEVQVRKIYCISRAAPNLPINIEDAARSEKEIEEAKLVCFIIV